MFDVDVLKILFVKLDASPESVSTGALVERKSGSRFRRMVLATQQVASQKKNESFWSEDVQRVLDSAGLVDGL
jgi:hypothetical protein